MAIPFLQAIVNAYSDRYSDLSRHLFIFPNRRAGTFFLKNLMQNFGNREALLPSVSTMSDFVENLSGGVVAGRIELLFILYEAYASLLRESGVKKVPEFDAFRRWGETALSDFNEVDMQDVDPDSIFKNVKDVKEISANFLTEEQLKVMEEFFGQAYDPENVSVEFWKNFNKGSDSVARSKFRMLWQVLAPLYHSMNRELEKRGLFTTGGAYRRAADLLEQKGAECIDASRVVMVGFNALTSSERRIFNALSTIELPDSEPDIPADEMFASFFWDATGPVITDRYSAAGRYVQSGISSWPSPAWAAGYISASDEKEMPEQIKVISVPSNSLQTKIVSETLGEMASRLPAADFEGAKVAVVLPDEGLLIPMLYSLPEDIEDVNLTMGYPIRLTATFTFVSLLRRMQASRRKTGKATGYYYKDLSLVLSHPYSQLLFGNGVSAAKEWIGDHHKYIVDITELGVIDSRFTELFAPLPDNSGAHEAAGWLHIILAAVADKLEVNVQKELNASVDLANINVYRLALSRLLDVVDEHGITMQWRTFLSLTDRLLASETVNFEGQPLKGLQVMGILETRALDFERIIIPSLNERILPARRRARTFISDSLRKAYGLPPVNYSESLFAYYFYRMISRAKEVVLLYDGRSSEGARSGDVSRYVLQLKYLYARDKIVSESRSFVMSKSELKSSEIAKTPEIMQMLGNFHCLGEEARNLSATALTRYAECQLRFYYEHVLRIRTDEEATDYIDAMTQGSVIHDVMQNVYLPKEMQHRCLEHPQIIDENLIRSRIEDTALIDRLITRSINERHLKLSPDMLDTPLEGSAKYVASALRNQVTGILNFDLQQAPIILYGVEIESNVLVEMRDGKKVNMRFAIDRLDSPSGMTDCEGRPKKRIVDYKTGTVHAVAESMESVFNGDYGGKNLLQLWLYANLFDALPDKKAKGAGRQTLTLFGAGANLPNEPLALELYDVSNMSKGRHCIPKVGEDIQKDHAELNNDFLYNLESMLAELFNKDVPFKPAQDVAACGLCPFKTICLR